MLLAERYKIDHLSWILMDKSLQAIQADFDKIALLADEHWNHNEHYHKFLLQQIPKPCTNALEIGCGTGAFSRLLAERTKQVLAVDLSPNMIALARQHSKQYPNIEFQLADAMSADLPAEHFDCIVSIATLHHMPTAQAINRMKQYLKTNGHLVILDLLQTKTVADIFTNVLAMPANMAIRFMKTRRFRPPVEVRRAWEEHGRDEIYLTLAEVRSLCEDLLPGAIIKKHLLWRYSIVWQKTC
jgi:ubiquinone/menaquinone biosynthesis C-methylase UbiE